MKKRWLLKNCAISIENSKQTHFHLLRTHFYPGYCFLSQRELAGAASGGRRRLAAGTHSKFINCRQLLMILPIILAPIINDLAGCWYAQQIRKVSKYIG
jgi:hypothetical protein